jgi:hypothetical protein
VADYPAPEPDLAPADRRLHVLTSFARPRAATIRSRPRAQPARLMSGDKPHVTLVDVAGVDEAKQELNEVVESLKYSEKFVALGARIPKGVLMVGRREPVRPLSARRWQMRPVSRSSRRALLQLLGVVALDEARGRMGYRPTTRADSSGDPPRDKPAGTKGRANRWNLTPVASSRGSWWA